MYRRRLTGILSMILCLSILCSLTGCGSSTVSASAASAPVLAAPSAADQEKYQEQIFTMDTIMTFTTYGVHGQEGLSSAKSLIYRLNDEFDPQIEVSDLYKVNAAAGTPVEISETVAKMIMTATKVYHQTNGALDISILPVVELWGFLDADFHVPTEEAIQEGLSHLCFEDIVVEEKDGHYFVTIPEHAAITLGAVAKGCAADLVLKEMAASGVTSGIVSLGGNIQTLGVKPDGKNWTVAVQDPNNTASYVGILSIGELAVVTSGTYQRFFEEDGQVYHHIIDPKTGRPADNELLSMTILTKDGTLADCLSTALFILGTDGALDYWRTYGKVPGEEFELILINKDREIVATSGLEGVFTLVNDTYTLSFTD